MEMCSNKTSKLQQHRLWPTHEKSGTHHAKRNELSRNGEKEKASLLPSCVLGCGIRHRQDQSWKEEDLAQKVLRKYLICCQSRAPNFE